MYNCIIHIDVFYYVLDVRIFFLVQISIKCILYFLLYFFISNKPVFFYHFFTCLNGIRPIWVIGFTCNLHCCFAQVKLIATILCHTSRPSSFFPFISQFIAIIVVIFFFITTKENLILIQFLLYILLQPCLKHLSPPTPFRQQLLSTPKHLYTLKIITFKSPH